MQSALNLAGNVMLQCIYNVIVITVNVADRLQSNNVATPSCIRKVFVALMVETYLQMSADPGSFPLQIVFFKFLLAATQFGSDSYWAATTFFFTAEDCFLYQFERAGFTTRYNSAKKQLTDLLSLHA